MFFTRGGFICLFPNRGIPTWKPTVQTKKLEEIKSDGVVLNILQIPRDMLHKKEGGHGRRTALGIGRREE